MTATPSFLIPPASNAPRGNQAEQSGSSPPEKLAAIQPVLDRVRRSDHWINTGDGPKRRDSKLTDALVIGHAEGRYKIGACPIERGSSTTRIALLDLDSHKGETPWPEMVRVAQELQAIARMAWGVSFTPFRSSGGNGIHLYALWDAPQDARSVRAALVEMLEACGLSNGTKGVRAGQVEVFPKQDSVPADGWGSMFVVPGGGRSEPLDPNTFTPIAWTAVEWPTSEPVKFVEPPAPVERAQHDAPELARVQSALDAIDPDSVDYDGWLRVLFAVHDATAGSAEGLALVLQWSSRWSGFDAHASRAETEKQWAFAKSRPGGVTAGTLFHMARVAGWVDPQYAPTAEGFEALVEEPKANEAPRFVVVPAGAFADRPSMRWRVKGVLPVEGVAMVYGAPGSGKSFFALDVCAAIARGLDWRGHRVAKGRVAYVAAEGRAGFALRVRAYLKSNGLDGIPGLGVIGDTPNLFAGQTDAAAIVAAVTAWGGADVIVIDTLAASSAGADENAGRDMNAVMARLGELQRATGALVVLVHHSGKDESRGARGWSGLKAAVDTEIEVNRPDEEQPERVARVTKQKDGESGRVFGFRLRTVELTTDEDGDWVTSCVVEPIDEVPTKRAKRITAVRRPRSQTQCIAFDALVAAGAPVAVDELVEAMIVPMPKPEGKDTRRALARRDLGRLVDGGYAEYTPGGACIQLCGMGAGL